MDPTLPELLAILDLEAIEANTYRGHHAAGARGRVFGGQIMAQALMAGGRTVDTERSVHSLHGYFLRPGDSRIPVLFTVDRIRDGRSFSTRRVVAIQNGEAIFEASASFQRRETGFEHQAKVPTLAPPTRLPDALFGGAFVSFMENFRQMQDDTPKPPYKRVWFRADGDLPDDSLLHACLITYQSDSDLLSTARLPHRPLDRSRLQRASLDHALWFHHPARADEWLLYDMDSPSAAQARGFSRGELYRTDGLLVASAMQESLMRMR